MADESPTIHYAAAIGPDGTVYRGPQCTKPEAVAWRRLGKDVVVRGERTAANRRLAREIEAAAVGDAKEDTPHSVAAGPNALPHFQPRMRPPAGHTFFETRTLKAEP